LAGTIWAFKFFLYCLLFALFILFYHSLDHVFPDKLTVKKVHHVVEPSLCS
jgi:hypothetical protein